MIRFPLETMDDWLVYSDWLGDHGLMIPPVINGSGSGYGHGSGYGDVYGDVYGDGDGDGHGSGSGDGYGQENQINTLEK